MDETMVVEGCWEVVFLVVVVPNNLLGMVEGDSRCSQQLVGNSLFTRVVSSKLYDGMMVLGMVLAKIKRNQIDNYHAPSPSMSFRKAFMQRSAAKCSQTVLSTTYSSTLSSLLPRVRQNTPSRHIVTIHKKSNVSTNVGVAGGRGGGEREIVRAGVGMGGGGGGGKHDVGVMSGGVVVRKMRF